MDAQMGLTKQKIDNAKNDQAEKAMLLIENQKKANQIIQKIHLKIKEKEVFHELLRKAEQSQAQVGKETENQFEAVKQIKDQIRNMNLQMQKLADEIEVLKKAIKHSIKEKDQIGKLKNAEIMEK